MVEKAQRKETASLTPLDKLAIVVHPLFRMSDAMQEDDAYLRETAITYMRTVQKFRPQTSSEMLFIMPIQREGKTIRHRAQGYKNSWISWFKRLKQISPDDTVHLAPDIEKDPNLGYLKLEERLRHLGKTITPKTQIIIGGEDLENCVDNVALNLLKSPHVRKVAIDTRVSIIGDKSKIFYWQQHPGVITTYLSNGLISYEKK